jgi:aminoglycoside/choline kinase family phosphotransferase
MTVREVDLRPLGDLVGRVHPGAELRATPMTGGASTRRYYRVALSGGRSAVGMFVPEGAKPEEIAKDRTRGRWPFLEVRELLASHGVAVPAVFAEDTARGWLLIEDLGDDTLANYLRANPGEKRALYTRAVEDLAEAQRRLASVPAGSVVASRAFDEDLLRWEIDHFREWGLDARGKALSPEDRAAYDAIADRLARRIAGWTRGFVHRDYQSRNLMVRTDDASPPSNEAHGAARRLVWLDFQDALMGPRVYDLVALLNDSYQEFERSFVEARLDEYAAHAGLGSVDRAKLGMEFDRVTVQRKLKDAGRFVFIDRMHKNSSFLKFVVPTERKIKDALARLAPEDEDMRVLQAILHRALPDEI